MSDRRKEVSGSTDKIMEGVKDALPFGLSQIAGEWHLTASVSRLMKIGTMAIILVSGYYEFTGQVNNNRKAIGGLKNELVVRDSLIRKDMRVGFESIRLAMETSTLEMVTARQTSTRELTTALNTINDALSAELEANRSKLQLELDNQARIIIDMNKTTYAELNLLIKSLDNQFGVEVDALKTRIELAEDLLQDQVKSGLFGLGKKR